MGPAPAVAAVRSAVRAALSTITPDAAIFVACSGGADSVALAAAVAFEARFRPGLRGLVTVDHGLQHGSDERAMAVAQFGFDLDYQVSLVLPVEVGATGGPEGAARAARYTALDACAAQYDALVLLAHTLDDQAESVLLGLARGSGPRSVVGMSHRDGHRMRPLLAIPRRTTRAACDALGLAVWDDPHNDDPRYTRVRLRHEVIPLLDEVLGGGVAGALARTGDLLRDDLAALDGWAQVQYTNRLGQDGTLDLGVLDTLPVAIRTRVLRLWALGAGAGALSASHLHTLDDLVVRWHGQDVTYLPGGFAVLRSSGRLTCAVGVPLYALGVPPYALGVPPGHTVQPPPSAPPRSDRE
jgi:tRNA(Ile)-lysidine synthase